MDINVSINGDPPVATGENDALLGEQPRGPCHRVAAVFRRIDCGGSNTMCCCALKTTSVVLIAGGVLEATVGVIGIYVYDDWAPASIIAASTLIVSMMACPIGMGIGGVRG